MPPRIAVALALAAAALTAAGCASDPRTSGPPDARDTASSRPVARSTGPPPGWHAGARARRARVPILMYHLIGHAAPGTADPGLTTRPKRFAAQLRALDRAGYTAVTLARVLDAWDRGSPLPRRPIVLTFDDGYPGHVRYVLPAMRRHGWPGVLNLELRNIGPGGLPADGVRDLLRAGWQIDSHTVSHPDLRTLPDAALREELVRSRRVLRRRFGATAALLCYPAGKHDDRVVAATRAAGYRAATTVEHGVAGPKDDRFRLPRLRADGDLPPRELLDRIRAAGGP